MEYQPKDDIAALCARAGVNPARYRRFERELHFLPPRPAPAAPAAAAPEVPLAAAPAPVPVVVTPAPAPAEVRSIPAPVAAAPAPAPQPAPAPVPAAPAPEASLHSLMALEHVFGERGQFLPETASRPAPRRLNTLCIWSAVGGAGATTVLASLSRALAVLGEHVLTADVPGSTLLPLHFGGATRSGPLLTAPGTGNSFAGSLRLLQLEPGQAETTLSRYVASGPAARLLLAPGAALAAQLGPRLWSDALCLVVVTPDLRSVLGIDPLLALFREQELAGGRPIAPYFLLNRYKAADPLDRTMRERLADRLGPQLLPLAIPESPEIPLALAQGQTVIDAFPDSAGADAFFQLAAWYRAAANATPALAQSAMTLGA